MRAKMDYGLETLVRMLYLEPAVRDRRILVLGKHAEEMTAILERMGAHSARPHVTGGSRPLPWDLTGLRGKRDVPYGSSLPARSGDVDLVFVPDLAEVQDYRAVLAEVARILGPHSILMLSVRNAECTVPLASTGLDGVPEMWSIESLEQLLAQYFRHVEITGQSPFLGYAVASYDPSRGRQGVRLDTSLMEEQGEEPEFVLALCAHDPPREPLSNALFQVPMAEMALVEGATDAGRGGRDTEADGRLRAELESVKRELGNRNVIVARLEKEIERLEQAAESDRQRMFDMRQKMEKERKGQQKEALESVMRREVQKTPETWLAERATLSRELDEQTRARGRAEQLLEETQKKLQKAEAAAARHESREKDARQRMERSEARARDLRVEAKQLQARLREEEARAPEMGRRIQELEKALDDSESKRRNLAEKLQQMDVVRQDEGRIRELEDELEKAGQERKELVSRRDRLAAENQRLVRELDARGEELQEATDRLGELRQQLDEDHPGDEKIKQLTAELERREELIRDLLRELEVLPTIIEEGRTDEAGDTDGDAHELVGQVERLRGENQELTRRAGELAGELEQVTNQLQQAREESAEAAALVTMVDDALDGAAGDGGGPTLAPAPGLDRFLRDLQEDLRRIAGDPRGAGVARDIGQLWVNIEKKRRTS